MLKLPGKGKVGFYKFMALFWFCSIMLSVVVEECMCADIMLFAAWQHSAAGGVSPWQQYKPVLTQVCAG